MKLGEYEQAIADCDRAIELDHKTETAYFVKGWAYQEIGEKDQAYAAFERVLELTEDPAKRQLAETQLQKLQETESEDQGQDATIKLQTYEHPAGAFVIDYPQGWTATGYEVQTIFVNPTSSSMYQAMSVTFGPAEQFFEGMESQSLAEIAEQIIVTGLEDMGSDYEITAKEQISESRVYLSTIVTDPSFVSDFYFEQTGGTVFMLMLASPPHSKFYQTWDAIVESYKIDPEAIE